MAPDRRPRDWISRRSGPRPVLSIAQVAECIFPRPRRIARVAGSPVRLGLTTPITLLCPETIAHVHRALRRILNKLPAAKRPRINLLGTIGAGNLTSQGYAIDIRDGGVTAIAADLAGARFAVTTLAQLIRSARGPIPALTITDWPDFPVRGVMLDISRDKVPTMRTLMRLIDRLADWRINHLQLYTEHTFAYRGHARVWRGASPMTPAQIRKLDRYCAERGIELVPNQNSFGHMERWLKHEPYRALAETTGPWKSPFGTIRTQAATLNPLDPRSLKLVTGLYDQLLPNFTSRLFNVGCDETFELGQGRSAAECKRRGVGEVYLDYLLKIHRALARRGRRMMFWSDVVHQHPRILPRLPKDAIALIWGYESDHPFDAQCRALRRAGLDFYVCPGTSSWCSFGGRTANMLANLRNAARAGRRHGAIGYLVTDWGDYGHRQQLPVSYPGWLFGAGIAWCAESNERIDLGTELSRLVFDGSSRAGELWCEAGRIHEPTRLNLKNKTPLFVAMHGDWLDPASVNGLTLRSINAMLARLKPLYRSALSLKLKEPDPALVRRELILTFLVLRHAVLRARAALNPRLRAAAARHLHFDLRRIMAEHRRLWLARNRPGGLASSLSYYERNLKEYADYLKRAEPRSRRRTNLITVMD